MKRAGIKHKAAKPATKKLTVEVSPEMNTVLKITVIRKNTSLSGYVNKLLSEYLKAAGELKDRDHEVKMISTHALRKKNAR